MARDESLPFNRGETFYNGNIPDLTNGAGGINLEGKEYVAEIAPASRYSGAVADPSGRTVRVKVVRNRSAINLLPRRIARYAIGTPNAGFNFGTGVDGYVFQTTDPIAGVVDELLPAAGVPPGDLFYVVTDGPTEVISATTGTISIAAGAQIAATTGTSAVSADAGFAIALNVSSTTVLQLQYKIGRAEANLAATVATNSAIFKSVVLFAKV
jgi:hypothetical protein